MNKSSSNELSANDRMKGYLEKVAAGPRLSKDLTSEEAEDGLRLVLNGDISPERSAVFLIATRMKLETVEENIGFWRAMNQEITHSKTSFDTLLQIADAFDGFQRVPYFGFYVLPVLSAMNLPTFGWSALPLPPKFGITFEDLLQTYYGKGKDHTLATRLALIEKFKFGYLAPEHAHPALESLRGLRSEIVKRPMLATLEKMLMPLQAKRTLLATNYFHPGYEISMLAVAKQSEFDHVIIGNGMEGTTLYGIHKTGKLFSQNKNENADETRLDISSALPPNESAKVAGAFQALKETGCTREAIAQLGEQALKGKDNPAFWMIASQAGTLSWLAGHSSSVNEGVQNAATVLKSGKAYDTFMHFLEAC